MNLMLKKLSLLNIMMMKCQMIYKKKLFKNNSQKYLRIKENWKKYKIHKSLRNI